VEPCLGLFSGTQKRFRAYEVGAAVEQFEPLLVHRPHLNKFDSDPSSNIGF
jgi:hypothetical protein